MLAFNRLAVDLTFNSVLHWEAIRNFIQLCVSQMWNCGSWPTISIFMLFSPYWTTFTPSAQCLCTIYIKRHMWKFKFSLRTKGELIIIVYHSYRSKQLHTKLYRRQHINRGKILIRWCAQVTFYMWYHWPDFFK